MMLSVSRLLLPLPTAAIRPATLCLEGSSGFSNLCASQQTLLCKLARSFASSPVKVKDPVKQFEVLRPFGAGGPVVRTPVFAVIKVGALQYKVSPGDLCYVERLKHLDVGAELKISSVQAAGTREQTFIGRPYVDGASVNAIIEEQVQDAKVISFKKRRRKNSRRIRGHRQLLTGLRITSVNGVSIPEEGRAEVHMA